MGSIYTAPVSGPPMPAVARILSRYDRPQPAAFIAIAIDLLDTLGPDTEDMPDFRPSSDGLPGAPDDAEPETADLEAGAYAEWHTLRVNQRRTGGCLINSCGNEDDEAGDHPEDDDPASQCDEDGVNTAHHFLTAGPGCDISDAGEPDARQLGKLRPRDDGTDPDYSNDDGRGSLPVRSLHSD